MRCKSAAATINHPVFQFDYQTLPWALGQGYLIKLCRTGETFEITDIKPDGAGARITVNLVQLGMLFVRAVRVAGELPGDPEIERTMSLEEVFAWLQDCPEQIEWTVIECGLIEESQSREVA